MNIEHAMRTLSSKRPVFHSEFDFQFALSQSIAAIHPDALIELEVPVSGVGEMDIIVHLDGQLYAIELKYKKASLSVEHNGRAYSLKKDGAADIGRCRFIRDIARLERFKGAIGFAIFLSNDPIYWKGSRVGGACEAFDVSEGRIIPAGISLDWTAAASEGTRRGHNAPFVLAKEHIISWSDYSTIAGSQFKYTIVKTEGGRNDAPPSKPIVSQFEQLSQSVQVIRNRPMKIPATVTEKNGRRKLSQILAIAGWDEIEPPTKPRGNLLFVKNSKTGEAIGIHYSTSDTKSPINLPNGISGDSSIAKYWIFVSHANDVVPTFYLLTPDQITLAVEDDRWNGWIQNPTIYTPANAAAWDGFINR